MEKHEIALKELYVKYTELGGKLFAQYFLRLKGGNEVKKILETNDFMIGLLNGKIKNEWKVEESQEYKEFLNLVESINYLNSSKQS
jgi:hypothetical protein